MPRRRSTTDPRQGRSVSIDAQPGLHPGHWKTLNDVPLDEEEDFYSKREILMVEEESLHSSDDDREEEIFPLKHPTNLTGLGTNKVKSGSETDRTKLSTTSNSEVSTKQGGYYNHGKVEEDNNSETDSESEGWGKKKAAYYSNNAGDLASEDEEGNELYLLESLRLQTKSRLWLSVEDFGLQEVRDPGTDSSLRGKTDPSVEFAVQPSIEFRSRQMEKEHPELLALAQDWNSALEELLDLENKFPKEELRQNPISETGLLSLYHQALQCYLTLLAFYLHLSSSGITLSKLKSHPIRKRLLILRETTQELHSLGILKSMDEELDEDGLSFSTDEPDEPNYVSSSDEDVDEEESEEERNTASRTRAILDEPEFRTNKYLMSGDSERHMTDRSSCFGDPFTIQRSDAEDKRARKKSLRFHTARIDGLLSRHLVTGQNRGGDDDISYPQWNNQGSSALQRETGSSSFKVAGRKRQQDQDSDVIAGDPDDYYELVKRQKRAFEEKKREMHETEQVALRDERDGAILNQEAAEGPRSLSRAILTNKGLTPQRSKAVRNPRVKKRMKYEKAKQKLSSQKAVYRGGPTNGKYGGELSGINIRAVKSVRF